MSAAIPTTLTLLLVEDEETIITLLQETLRDAGFELEVAKSGDEALAILDAKSETLRGLITDINLGAAPGGWDVAKHARELSPDIPVLYISGASGHEWTSHGVPNSTIVAKPFALAQIVTAISALLNKTDS
jgi:DNA-binding response OmpR family regulator